MFNVFFFTFYTRDNLHEATNSILLLSVGPGANVRHANRNFHFGNSTLFIITFYVLSDLWVFMEKCPCIVQPTVENVFISETYTWVTGFFSECFAKFHNFMAIPISVVVSKK